VKRLDKNSDVIVKICMRNRVILQWKDSDKRTFRLGSSKSVDIGTVGAAESMGAAVALLAWLLIVLLLPSSNCDAGRKPEAAETDADEEDDEATVLKGRLTVRPPRDADDAGPALARASAFSMKSNSLLRHRSSFTAASGAKR
jgi:hypothetical protein